MSTEFFIKKSNEKFLAEKKEYQLFNKHFIIIAKPLPKEINIVNVIKKIEKYLPFQLANNLNNIFVGNYEILDEREVESIYINHDIYISNNQSSEELMTSTIVHEIAHSLEEKYGEQIYGDSEVIDEFIAKRKKLASMFKEQNIDFNIRQMINTSFDPDLDNFFYKEVGYDRLNRLTSGLFISPYACTSIREYFSNGFECYFLSDRDYLQKISPKLCRKINVLTEELV